MKKILIIDDDALFGQLIADLLGRNGYEILKAHDGLGGLEAAAARPDLIVLDLALPDMDGWQVLRRLKGAPESAAIPVVVCSMHDQRRSQEQAFAAGAAGFIAKPFQPSEFLTRIQELIAHA